MVVRQTPDATPGGPAARLKTGRVITVQSTMHYEITVEGALDERWSSWFEGLCVTSDASGKTTISGPVVDQAALLGLLVRVRDLGLPLIAVHRVESD